MPLSLSSAAVQRMLRSLLVAELAAVGGRHPDAASWPEDLSFGPDGLALDSLELLACASAANQLFHLHETGIEDYLLARRRLDQWVAIVDAALREGVSGFSFATSGSTGAPQRCTHALPALHREACFWAERYQGIARIVQGVPAHHIYGALFTALLPDILGVPVLDARSLAPGVLARSLGPGDLLVGFPAGLAQLLRSLAALPAGLRCVSSTAPLPEATHRALRAAGAGEVVEIYGSTETAGIGLRTGPAAPFRLLPRWRPGRGGEVASVIEVATGIEHPLPDRATWEDRGSLRLLGRKDGAVQVGGVNVLPARVAARIAGHPMVADCAVRLDVSLAEPRLKAFIVPAPDVPPEVALATLEAWSREVLSAAERPVRFDAGAALPRNAMGKPADWSRAA